MSDCLCEDLIGEVFERLPVKSLLRFRYLSKSCCSHIDRNDFIRRHTFRSMKSPQKVLIKHRVYGENKKNFKGDFYTLHSKDRLPLCPSCGYNDIKAIKLSVPYLFSKMIGSRNGILCLFDCYYGKGDIIYTMKTNTWSEIASPTITFTDVKSRACFLNGTLHWLVKYDVNETLTRGYHMLMTFDLNTHEFGTISLPEHSSITTKVKILNGSLALISGTGHNTWIWVRRECEKLSPWIKAFKLEIYPLKGDRDVKSITNCDLLLDNIHGDSFEVYNLETRVLSRLLKFVDYCKQFKMETYVESLELLDRGTP